MSPEKSTLVGDADEEVSALIATLHATGQRLEELTSGEVDAVADRHGQTFLLRGAQEQLRHIEAARQAAILNALPAHIALLDAHGLIVSVNDAWRRFGCAAAIHGPGHAIGLNYFEICRDARGEGACEALQVAEGIRWVLDGRERRFSIEYPCHSPTEQRWFLLTVTPLADDHPNGAVVMHVNVTAERQAEESLRASELRFRQMADSIRDVFFLQNLDSSQIYYVSPAYEQIWGRSCESLYADPASWGASIHPDDLGYASAKFKEGRTTGFDYEFRIVRPDGEMRWIHVRGFPILDDAGNPYRTAGVASDVTQRKQASEEMLRASDALRQSQKMEAVGQLTGGVAHDFNNLLTVIIANVEMAREAVGLDEGTSSMLASAHRAAERGGELTGRLLAFSRRQNLLPQRIDINHLATEVIKLLRRTLGEAVQIVANLDFKPLYAVVDPGQLENALINLCVNARDAMPDGGTISIATSAVVLDNDDVRGRHDVTPGAYRVIAISDSGTGMTEEVKARAFEPFFTTKEVGKGSGLGLSMVYGFLKQSGGHVTIYSEIGRGTTIRLYLAASADDQIALAPAAARGPTVIGAGKSVLLVEDNDMVQAAIVAMLRKMGFATICAQDGLAALKALGEGSRFDLMITDVIMPKGMNGIQLAKTVQETWPGLPILFISGYSRDTKTIADAVRSGGTFLSKPFSRAQFSDAIQAAMKEKPAT